MNTFTGKVIRSLLLLGCITLGLSATGLLLRGGKAQADATLQGVVTDSAGPLAGARVRVRATDNLTFTDVMGQFALMDLVSGAPVEVAAWSEGYYIASEIVTPPINGVTITLRPYHTIDHPGYSWTNPISGTASKSCGNCHPMLMPQWEGNAHGGSVDNARFFSLYNGTDLAGTTSVGPGYLQDFPGTAGTCASCHAPGAGVDGYLTTGMNSIRGVITAGIHCDYCHKIGGIYLDPATGSVYPNAPGTLSQRVLRPPLGDEIFFGPFDDIPDPDTFLPLISESQFCAPCHQFSFWGTPIYESYNEWLASPYSAQGVTCQDCHMPPNGDIYFASPGVGGLPHPPEMIPSHLQRGAADELLLQETVAMTVKVQQIAGVLQVAVAITNTEAGHHVPTDQPGRHMILTVQAFDDQGLELPYFSGSQVPAWGGPEAGLPGKIYAKVLRDVETGEWPVVSYWKQTQILSDNRLVALESDVSIYTFNLAGSDQEITVMGTLQFRRAPWALMSAKGWADPDITMETYSGTILATPWWDVRLPLVLN